MDTRAGQTWSRRLMDATRHSKGKFVRLHIILTLELPSSHLIVYHRNQCRQLEEDCAQEPVRALVPVQPASAGLPH